MNTTNNINTQANTQNTTENIHAIFGNVLIKKQNKIKRKIIPFKHCGFNYKYCYIKIPMQTNS